MLCAARYPRGIGRWLACGVLLVVGACSDAPPPEELEDDSQRAEQYVSPELDEELERIGERVRERGFSPAGDAWRGFLVNRGTATRRLSLRSGQCVVFVAVASPQLTAVELAVHDGDGSEMVRSGVGEWGVSYCAASSGVHFVVARAEGDGLFAIQRFDGPRGLALRFDDLRPRPSEPTNAGSRGPTP